jgi:hypothetical protein
MRKHHRDFFLIEMLTSHMQGKSWLEVGNDSAEFSRRLSRLVKCRDFLVASHAPREPHMLRFKGTDLSSVADKSFDFVLFNWSIGQFPIDGILQEAARIARECIIVQDFMQSDGQFPSRPLGARYTYLSEFDWHSSLRDFGEAVVCQTIPEGSLDLNLRRPAPVRLICTHLPALRDTLPAGANPETEDENFANFLRSGSDAAEATKEFISKASEVLATGSIYEDVLHEPLFPNLVFGPSLTEVERAIGRTFREGQSVKTEGYYNGEDMIGDDTPLEELQRAPGIPFTINKEGLPDTEEAEKQAFLDSSRNTEKPE